VRRATGAKTTLLSAYLFIRSGSPTPMPASPVSSSTGPAPSCAPHCTSCAKNPARGVPSDPTSMGGGEVPGVDRPPAAGLDYTNATWPDRGDDPLGGDQRHGGSPHPQQARRPSTNLDLEDSRGRTLLKHRSESRCVRLEACTPAPPTNISRCCRRPSTC
jgi:hypothetical protein